LIALMSGIKATITLVRRGHGGTAEKLLQYNPRLIKHYCEMCPVCMKKYPMTQPARGRRKPIRSINSRGRFQIEIIVFCKLRKRDPFGVFMGWVLVIKNHATDLVCLRALPRKCPNLVAYELQEIFGIIGFPKIIHTHTMEKSSLQM
jgi:hypothetical protein